MADVIHEVHSEDSSSTGLIIGLLIAILVIGSFFFFVWPRVGTKDNTGQINVVIPAPAGGGNSSQ